MFDRIVVIADDFTGACDTGVQLATSTRFCPVILDVSDPQALVKRIGDALDLYGSVVVDTASRHSVAADAAAVVSRCAHAAVTAKANVVYKKIDSTLRGNIAHEIAAAVKGSDRGIAVVAPAYPAAGRTTRNGLCLVDGTPVVETEFGTDPRSPVSSSRIRDVLPDSRVLHAASAEDLRACLDKADPGTIVVADATSETDLDRIVEVCSDRIAELVMVGSAGLAEAIARGRTADGEEVLNENRGTAGAPDKSAQHGVLAVVGSRSERARRQISRAATDHGCRVIELSLVPTDGSWSVSPAVVTEIIEALGSNRRVIVVPPHRLDPNGPGAEDVSAALSSTAARTWATGKVLGFFLTGGDTARSVAAAVGATEILIRSQVEPGVPAVTLIRQGDPIRAVTKAGGFGSDDAIVRAFDYLMEDSCWV